MNRTLPASLALCLCAAAGVGCTTETDPDKATTADILFRQPEIKEELERKRANLAALGREESLAKQETVELERIRDDREARRAQLRAQLAETSKELAKLDRALSETRAADTAAAARLNRLKRDRDALQEKVDNLVAYPPDDAGRTRAEIAEVEAKLERLVEALEAERR